MKHGSAFILTILSLLLAIWIAWIAASDHQRRTLLVFLGLEQVKRTTAERMSVEPFQFPTPSELGKERWVFDHPKRSACKPRQARNLARIDEKRIYRWTDENGQAHFSDRAPMGAEAQLLDSALASSKDRFQLRIKFDGIAEPTDFRDKVDVGSRRIYSFFRSHLHQGELPPLKIELVVAGSASRFERYRKRLAPTIRTGSNGFYDHGSNQALVRFRPKRPSRTLAVARHEISHLIIGNIYGDTDTWLNEGLAELFEHMESYGMVATYKSREKTLARLRRAIRKDQLPALDTLLSSGYPTWRRIGMSRMYSYAWSLVYFLVSSDSGRSILENLLKSQKERRCKSFSSKDFLQREYPGGIAGLSEEWRTWLFDKRDKNLFF